MWRWRICGANDTWIHGLQLKKQRWTHARNCEVETLRIFFAQLDTRGSNWKRGALFWRALVFPLRSSFFITDNSRFRGGGRPGVVDARWIRAAKARPVGVQKKAAARVLFRNRSNHCRDVGMTHLALSFLLPLSLSFLTSSSRRSRGEFHWPGSALWRALCPACHTDAIIDAHTFPFSILIPPSPAHERDVARKGHYTSRIGRVHNHFFRSGILLRMYVLFLSHERNRWSVCATFWPFLPWRF